MYKPAALAVGTAPTTMDAFSGAACGAVDADPVPQAAAATASAPAAAPAARERDKRVISEFLLIEGPGGSGRGIRRRAPQDRCLLASTACPSVRACQAAPIGGRRRSSRPQPGSG